MGERDEGEDLIDGLGEVRRELTALLGELDGCPAAGDLRRLLLVACDCVDEAVMRIQARISGRG